MPLRPGTNLSIKDSPPPQVLPVDTGTIFMVGVTEKGPLAPVVSRTLTEWQNNHGVRNTNTQTASDAAEFLFKEGAKKIVTSRVVGPGAVTASIAVTDAGAATVWTAKAKGPGAYGNDLNMVIRTSVNDATIAAGSYRIRIQRDDGVTILEESPDLANKSAGEYWMDTVSQWVTYTDGASANNPNRATFALAGGNDDIAGITDTQWQNATNLLSLDLGTGILIAPGRTSDTGHSQLKTHAENNNRVAFTDAPDTATIATLTASAGAIRSRFAAMFWPWVRVPGVTAASVRTVAPSVIAAGIAARNDALGYSPNKPAAGVLGVSNTAVGLSQDNTVVTDANHQTLNAAGVNVIRNRFGQFRIMGWRTTAAEATDPKWINLGGSRLIASIRNGAWLVGERFLFREIDGKGQTINEFGAALAGEVLMPYWRAGSLYGAAPDDAFRVDLSANTLTTAQNRQLLADMVVVESEFGEEIDISIAKNLITEGV
jgi:phage tail sheath protein FI